MFRLVSVVNLEGRKNVAIIERSLSVETGESYAVVRGLSQEVGFGKWYETHSFWDFAEAYDVSYKEALEILKEKI